MSGGAATFLERCDAEAASLIEAMRHARAGLAVFQQGVVDCDARAAKAGDTEQGGELFAQAVTARTRLNHKANMIVEIERCLGLVAARRKAGPPKEPKRRDPRILDELDRQLLELRGKEQALRGRVGHTTVVLGRARAAVEAAPKGTAELAEAERAVSTADAAWKQAQSAFTSWESQIAGLKRELAPV